MHSDTPTGGRALTPASRRLFLGTCAVSTYLFFAPSAGAAQSDCPPHGTGPITSVAAPGTLPDTGAGSPAATLVTATALLISGLLVRGLAARQARKAATG
ncbi:MAG: hypothetical protein HOV83_32960 [Catenulispora sp.]|nr:hypothetical protein [Catenulispora sp.]